MNFGFGLLRLCSRKYTRLRSSLSPSTSSSTHVNACVRRRAPELPASSAIIWPTRNVGCCYSCCESAPSAPKEIIPDPDEITPCVFTLKSMGMLSKNYVAYQGEDTSDNTKKWQFVHKKGYSSAP